MEHEIDDMPALVSIIPVPKENLVVGKRYYLGDSGGNFSRKIVELIEIDLDDNTALIKELADEKDANGVSTPGIPHFHDPNNEIRYYVYFYSTLLFEYI